MRRAMDKAYLRMSGAYAGKATHMQVTDRSEAGSARKTNHLQMDKNALLKGDDGNIKQHVDTYEYISNTFKNLHD